MLAGGKQQIYQGTTLRKPFFFLLVDSVFGSFLEAAVCAPAWELPLSGACAVWDTCGALAEAESDGGFGVAVEFAVVASAAGEAVAGSDEAFAAVLAVAPAVESVV